MCEVLDPLLTVSYELLGFCLLGYRYILIDEPSSSRDRGCRLVECSNRAAAAHNFLLRPCDLRLCTASPLVAGAACRPDLLILRLDLRLGDIPFL